MQFTIIEQSRDARDAEEILDTARQEQFFKECGEQCIAAAKWIDAQPGIFSIDPVALMECVLEDLDLQISFEVNTMQGEEMFLYEQAEAIIRGHSKRIARVERGEAA